MDDQAIRSLKLVYVSALANIAVATVLTGAFAPIVLRGSTSLVHGGIAVLLSPDFNVHQITRDHEGIEWLAPYRVEIAAASAIRLNGGVLKAGDSLTATTPAANSLQLLFIAMAGALFATARGGWVRSLMAVVAVLCTWAVWHIVETVVLLVGPTIDLLTANGYHSALSVMEPIAHAIDGGGRLAIGCVFALLIYVAFSNKNVPGV